MKDQCLIETIDLEKTYESTFNESYSFKDIIESKNCNYASVLLKDSIYVEFLEEFKGKPVLNDSEIKESNYYKMILNHIKNHGAFNGKKDDASLLLYCRNFLDLYHFIRRKKFNSGSLFSRSINHTEDSYPLAFKILNTDHYMIYDGHHRASCQLVLGRRFIKAKILGTRMNNFQPLQYQEGDLKR